MDGELRGVDEMNEVLILSRYEDWTCEELL